MSNFKRGMGEALVEKLGAEALFQSKLKIDIEEGKVFFAIRNGYGSFYVNGSSLFSYSNSGFTTHHKFGFVPSTVGKDYIAEADLKHMSVIEKFIDGYDAIKERATKYAGIEASGVSALYKFAPTLKNLDEQYFLVDTEVVFNAANDTENQESDDSRKTDRIDILLYDNHKRQLLFCEAKHFSNSELWAKSNSKPKVVSQLNKYNNQISSKTKSIISEYENTFAEYNQLMGTKLQSPLSVCKQCGLLIFGFDRNQMKRIKELLIADGSLLGYKHKLIGDILSNSRNTNTVKNIFTALR